MSIQAKPNDALTSHGPYPEKFQQLLNTVSSYNTNVAEDEALLYKAYNFAKNAHKGQFRRTGEEYFEHVFSTALILSELSMDTTTIIAGFLHDVVEDTNISAMTIAEEFTPVIAELVQGVTKIGGIKFGSTQEQQAENFLKMFLSVAQDIRVLIVKFADRLHNMRTLYSLPVIKQRRIAIETRDIYAPLASRLGMYSLKMEFEDLAFKYLEPDFYKNLDRLVKSQKEEMEAYIKRFSAHIQKSLARAGLEVRIFGRLKHYYSIHKKMLRQGKKLDEIYDVMAIRVIVKTVADCYATLGIVHQEFVPVSERFRDFIAKPKTNGYQSVHTTVVGLDNKMIEVQIRTEDMHRTAEVGIAAHWKYKESKGDGSELDNQVKWLRELVEALKNDPKNDAEFMEMLKIDLFQDEIFVFTPNNDLLMLPKAATPLDFAFAVHTEVGLKCLGAKVNGRIVPLNSQLTSGDRVEVLTSNNYNLSYNWLSFVKTSRAKNKIRKWLRQNEYEQSVRLGEEILEKGFRRLKMADKIKEAKERFGEMNYQTADLFYQAMGKGDITLRDVVNKLFRTEESDPTPENESGLMSLLRPFTRSPQGIRIQGIDGMMVNFAHCCNPIPGDDIVGFVTRGRGITIHRSECRNIPKLSAEEDRFLDVEWDISGAKKFITHLKIMCEDRKNMIYDISDAIRETKTNMLSINFEAENKIGQGDLAIEVESVKHAKRIMTKIKKIPGVLSIERI